MNRSVWCVEGVCKKVFIQDMYCKKKYTRFSNNIEKFNICYENVQKIIRKYSGRNVDLYFILDTDVLIINQNSELDFFSQNLRLLKEISNNCYFLIQHRNFEEELVRSCDQLNSVSDLFRLFNTKNKSEFKSNFINQENRIDKLVSSGFDISKLWCNEPEILSSYKIEQKKGVYFSIK